MAGFDIIGDVHGCAWELEMLLDRLGYRGSSAPPGRQAIFLGDLVDRGPACPEVAERVMGLVARGQARCLRGNHEHQLLEHLAGRFPLAFGLEETVEQFARRSPGKLLEFARFAEGLPLQLELDPGALWVAHAGLPERWQGSAAPEARQFALYGTPRGTRRVEWAAEYRGSARVVYGHTPARDLRWVGLTLCLDTGCVYGGALSALRYPEGELVSIPARRRYYEGV